MVTFVWIAVVEFVQNMRPLFCPKCNFPLETESVKYIKKEYKEMLTGFMRCSNCKTNYKTPNTNNDESWKKKLNSLIMEGLPL